MGIEPLGSVMTMQAQSTMAPKPAVKTEEAAEYNNANVQSVDKIDKTTSLVENAREKGQSDNSAQNGGQQQLPASEQIKKAVEKLTKDIMPNSEAVFGIHDETKRVTIKIVDKDTKKVIKEYPPEKTLDMIAKVWEIAGIMVDEKR